MIMRIFTALFLVSWVSVSSAFGQPDSEGTDGISIDNQTVIEACGICHITDEPGILSRISYRRTTPEGWQRTIKRMVSLNDMILDPDEAREIVGYLSNNLGLAPEEARGGAFEVEHRLIEYEYEADRDTELTCSACHSMGRILNQRRTKEEWALVVAMHRGYYPTVDRQGFREGGMMRRDPPAPDETPERRHPMNRAIDHLAEVFPLHSSAWAAWSANLRAPQLEGSWMISGNHPGSGPVFGRMTISAGPSGSAEFTTDTTLVYARDGRSVTHAGQSIVYTGYQWRGSSEADAAIWRQVMFVERDWTSMSGRWFRGAWDEIGLDVTLTRVDGGPSVSGVYPRAVRTSTSGQEVSIYGANLPEELAPEDVNLGAGVKLLEVVSVTPGVASVRISVEDGASVGDRDVFVGRGMLERGIVVYDQMDRITVEPVRGMARVGGVVVPKQYEQFDTVAWHDGPDGAPNTDDDLNLGVVAPNWSLEEYAATYGDEDLKYVGSLGQNGVFTPAVDGPNPERVGNRNNIGDVWVVATYTPAGVDTPLKARGHLVVTVPVYMRFDSWEVGR